MINRPLADQLDAILDQYETVAKSNATKLRLRIPAKEIWRYFVEAERYNTNINLSTYLDINALNQPEHRAHLDSTLDDIQQTHFIRPKWNKFLTLMHLDAAATKKIKVGDILRFNKGWFLFELSEPGYLQALYKAFDHIFDKDSKLSVAQIKRIHRTATTKVRNTNYERASLVQPSAPGQVRQGGGIKFQLKKANSSPEGIHQILTDEKPYACFHLNNSTIFLGTLHALDKNCKCCASYRAQLENDAPHFLNKLRDNPDITTLTQLLFDEVKNDNLFFLSAFNESVNVPEQIEIELESIVRLFNERIENAPKMLDKLVQIVDVVQSLEQLHPFEDGNCRTFCMILLNHLLAVNGMPLCLIHDANCFDAFSFQEIVYEVLAGMERTFELINFPERFTSPTDQLMTLADERNTIGANSRYFQQAVGIEERSRRRLRPFLQKHSLNDDGDTIVPPMRRAKFTL